MPFQKGNKLGGMVKKRAAKQKVTDLLGPLQGEAIAAIRAALAEGDSKTAIWVIEQLYGKAPSRIETEEGEDKKAKFRRFIVEEIPQADD
jgi:hypothetical protein